ncbi:mechanosensitive ion channel domain-containing protein [uncultured Mucilaginibacter sp.]|uniref:mechanosensitive ion channel family protein n=1 Tax=uncultured Mucilaginibacter sp. TaxID=797541 RepID=UPI002614BB33|nr:mechanosensitive ion channel domain-containing protein [uncultured Mucilaginibacter sp.]
MGYPRFSLFYKLVLLCLYFLFLVVPKMAAGQENIPVKTASDSAKTTLPPKAAAANQVVPDTLLFRIAQAKNAIEQINSHNKTGYNLEQIRTELPEVQANVAEIKEDMVGSTRIIETKTLLSYQNILKNEQSRLSDWRATLSAYNSNLRQMSQQIVRFSADTILSTAGNDTTQESLYSSQLQNLRLQLQQTGKTTTASLDSVGKVLAQVSSLYFEMNDLQANIRERLKATDQNAFSKESPYLWSAPPVTTTTNLGNLFRSSYQGQNRVLSYFINNTWDNRLLLMLFGIAFFIWVFRNFKAVNKLPANPKLTGLKFSYISAVPVLATLIVVLSLAPLFEPNSPPSYIELVQFVLLVVLTLFFRKRLNPQKFKFWLLISAFYATITVTVTVLNYGLILRSVLILLNLGSVYLGFVFYKRIDRVVIAKKYLKPVTGIFFLLNGLAVLLNLFGRISLAKVFSQTAIASLTQIVGLAVLVHILSEAFELQTRISSSTKGIFSKINFSKVRKAFRKALSIVAVLLWLLVFFINLNFSGALFSIVETMLYKQHALGSINYTLGNILLFGIIIYLSNWLQKNIGILLGEESSAFMGKTEHKSSKLALIRLVIILVGFFLAINASGIQLDKLTIVLGALSVGIGLGMQNIVNNFVSGIILIFEKPFQVGDFIELADKKGKVLDIGIRASRMLTQQGSEVIVPNGDLLSARLVNWTLSNTYLRTEMLLKVNTDADLDSVKKIIEEEVGKAEDTVKNTPVEILFNTVAADSIELKLLVWINSVYTENSFKGKILEQLFIHFKEKGIKMM